MRMYADAYPMRISCQARGQEVQSGGNITTDSLGQLSHTWFCSLPCALCSNGSTFWLATESDVVRPLT